jgi:hypothetical protein
MSKVQLKNNSKKQNRVKSQMRSKFKNQLHSKKKITVLTLNKSWLMMRAAVRKRKWKKKKRKRTKKIIKLLNCSKRI